MLEIILKGRITNIKTKEVTNFYDEDSNLVYSFNESFDLPIIIKDTNKYGVEFNSQLLYVNKDDVEETHANTNTDLKNKSKIRTITYHFFYDAATESCNQSICLSLTQLEEQFKYILNEFKRINISRC